MSTTQYATTYRINPATAAKAFAQLVDEGVLYKRRGIGMFVSPQARTALGDLRRDRFLADVVEPMIAQARLLGIPLTEVIGRIQQSRRDDESSPDESRNQTPDDGHGRDGVWQR
jgi:GntR family transcriptional regulator